MKQSGKSDLIVVGGGILGTFHAWHAAALGKKVLLIEKDQYPVNATVRNFGQVVPSGMAADWFQYGVHAFINRFRRSLIFPSVKTVVSTSHRMMTNDNSFMN
jgi:glycine/D-amino acid oxidase-like deaminating enzyme